MTKPAQSEHDFDPDKKEPITRAEIDALVRAIKAALSKRKKCKVTLSVAQ